MPNTFAYVDGYNLYYGIIDKRNSVPPGMLPHSIDKPWANFLWCNLDSMLRSFNFRGVDLIKIKFFEAVSYKSESRARQQVYINALMTLDSMKDNSIFGGDYKERINYCDYCSGPNRYFTEKGSDVQLAVELISDVLQGLCDSAIIVSGDNDLLPAYRKIKEYKPAFPLYLVFPPHRRSTEAARIVGQPFTRRLTLDRLSRHQFPETIHHGGFVIQKPDYYSSSDLTHLE